jgi:hypothetical protein
MKKQTHKNKFWFKRNILFITLGMIVIFAGAFLATERIHYYNTAADQANIVEIRSLILLATNNIKKSAPVDPKTGDIYFPEAKLYLPNPRSARTLTYQYDAGNGIGSHAALSISTSPVLGTQFLYTAKNTSTMFKSVPHLQACSRGIQLVYNKLSSNDTQNIFKNTIRLNNNRDLYIYVDKDCPELNDTVTLLGSIQPY